VAEEASIDESLEGWCTDPFGRHEARWISSGRATFLVRDGHIESHDDPPDETPSRVPEPIVSADSPDSTRRADDAQLEYWDPQRAMDAGSTTVNGGWLPVLLGKQPIWRPAKRRRHGTEDEPA
jgi:hypothetical protein